MKRTALHLSLACVVACCHARDYLISDCIVKPSENRSGRIIKSTKSGITAISLELVDGGVMDGVVMNNIQIEGTECPIYVRLGNRGRKHTLSNIYVSATCRPTGCSSGMWGTSVWTTSTSLP